jgi:DNA processing protein
MENRTSIIMALTELGGVGPRTFQQLLLRMGPPENLLSASRQEFEDIPRIGPEGAAKIRKSLDLVAKFQRRLESYSDLGIIISTYLDDNYPEVLRQIDDPPPILYMKGNRDVLKFEYIALVGTTRATQDGLRLTVDLAKEFIRRGYGIVSGLASGIDSAAHVGAIAASGPTIAVLGCGILRIYPPENALLAENIANTGLLISEHGPHRRVKAVRLILRNRLISAFSKAVIVVQVGVERRGELRTAQYAAKQAKPVFFADPEGSLDVESIKESNAVMIKGVDSVDDIIQYLV